MAFTTDTLHEEEWSIEGLIQEFEEHDYIQRDWERNRPLALQVLQDFKDNKNIDFYLYFGKCPRKIVDNYDSLLHAEKFGYTISDMVINEYGWAKFQFEEEYTTLVYETGKNVMDKVEYSVARSKNNLFVTGCSYTTGTFGSHSSPHMYTDDERIFKTKKDAEIYVVGYLIEQFEKAKLELPKSAFVASALKALTTKMTKLAHGDIVQLQLFA